MKKYCVYWIGGKRDGEILAWFETEQAAVMFAREFSAEHEAEFDPICGGVGIDDETGAVVMGW